MANSYDGTPRREDHGDLMVLHLYGSSREMGRQHVDLLGPLARDVYELQRGDWKRLAAEMGLAVRLADRLLPGYLMWVWRHFEQSGTYQAIRGMANGLEVSGADSWRGAFGFLGGGSNVFIAARTATADGTAVMGRNVDWPDGHGCRRPVVTHYHPTNGDLSYVGSGWPLLPVPTTAVNEAGFALAINFFNSDQILGLLLPQWPLARTLQQASTVGEGLRIFASFRTRGISGLVAMADANGDIAMIECTPSECAVSRPNEDWFAQTNHAQTEKMIPHDRGRHPNSFSRLAAMENAVTPHLGKITPEIAAQIIRDCSHSPFVDGWNVGNAFVLNAVVVHPGLKTLWHSTTMQPLAPFGEMIPFSVAADVSDIAPLPADPRLGTSEMARQAEVIAEMRRAVHLFREGQIEEAATIWDRFADEGEPLLDPCRLAWARARACWTRRRYEEAEVLLAGLDADAAPFDVRAFGIVARALVMERLGRRSDAVRFYQQAQAYLNSRPDYTAPQLVDPIRGWISAGLAGPQTSGPMPQTPDLQGVPQ